MNIDKKALKGVVDEIEASRARQKGETEFQREALKRAAKEHQLDAKAIRIVLQRRAMGEAKRDEQDYYVHSYELALGGKKAAQEALERGASIREAAKAGGISTGAAAALAKGVQESSFVNTDTVARDANGNPLQCNNDGEITETPVERPAGASHGDGCTVTSPAPATAITESCGPCPVSAADGAAKGNGLPSAKGKAEHESPAARRHTSDDALAPALGTSQREDGASPGPQDPDDDLAFPDFLDVRRRAQVTA
jgi:uncharacterized protein (UPF0335 family)